MNVKSVSDEETADLCQSLHLDNNRCYPGVQVHKFALRKPASYCGKSVLVE